MGMRVMTTGNNGAATRPIRRILLHPQYDQFTSDYDIALLELSAPIFFNDLVQPVCVPAPTHTFTTGTSCYVTGWGVLMEDGKSCSGLSDETKELVYKKCVFRSCWCFEMNLIWGNIDKHQGRIPQDVSILCLF